MSRYLRLILFVLLSGIVVGGFVPFAPVGTVAAAGESCSEVPAPTTLSESGCYELTGDLTDSNASTAVNITASDVVFDGMDYTLDSDQEGQYGVRVGSTGDVTNVTIRNVTITDFENGVYLENTNESEIRGTYITTDSNLGGADWAIWLEGSADNTIEDNTIFGTDLSIKIESGSSYQSPRNAIINNNIGNSILTLSNDTTIKNNDISGATNKGVQIEGTYSDPIEGTVIQNNIVSSSGDAGIYINYANATSVLDNELRNNGVGIETYGRTPNTVVRNTTSVDNGRDVIADITNGYPEPTVFEDLDIGTAIFSEVALSDIGLSGTTTSSPSTNGEPLGINFTAYDISGSGDGFLDVDHQYDDTDIVGLEESTVALNRYTFDSGTWLDEPATVDTESNTVTANLTSISSDGSMFALTAEEPAVEATVTQNENVSDVFIEGAVANIGVPIPLGDTDSGNATGVQYSGLDVTTTRDATYNLTVETNQSGFDSAPALNAGDGLVYSNISHPDLADSDIDQVAFALSVDATMLPQGVDIDDVSLYRYNNGWTQLSTSQIGHSGDTYELQAISPGLSVFAVAVSEPDIEVSPTSYFFETVGVDSSGNTTVTINNDGDADLNVTDISLSGANASEFANNESSVIIPPDDSREVVITFSPTTYDPKRADLTIESDDPDEPTVNVTLEGQGVDITDPVADISVDDSTPTVGQTVSFAASGSTDDNMISSYNWEFGDGSIATGVSTNHAYSSAGTYTASLTVIDEFGNTDQTSQSVTVSTTSSGGSSSSSSSSSESSTTDDETVEVTATEDSETEDDDMSDSSESDDTDVSRSTASGSVSAGSTLSIDLIGDDQQDSDEPAEDADQVADEDDPTGDQTVDDEPAEQDETTEQEATDNTGSSEDRSPPVSQAEIERVEIDVSEDVDAEVEIRQSRNPPSADASEFRRSDGTQPAGYVQITDNLDDEQVTAGRISFRVQKDDLETDAAAPETIAMYHYIPEADEWEELPTDVVDETETYIRFRAETPGFSQFATGIKRAQFEISDALVDVQEVTLGDSIQVEAIVTNTGGADGTFTTQLLVDSEVVAEDILTIASSGTRATIFDYQFTQAAVYEVRVNDVSTGNITVTDPDTVEPATEATLFDEIPGFGFGAGVVALVVSVLIASRRAID